MADKRRTNMAMLAVIGLLTLNLMGTPVLAGHELGPATSLEATFAVGALLNYDRAAQHYQHYNLYRSQGQYARQPGHVPVQEAVTMFPDTGPQNTGSSR